MKKTDGFTLVELMVGILCASLVSGAIAAFMLMGLRTNRTVIDSNVEQQNARIIMTMVESLASEGSITRLEVDGELTNATDDGSRAWILYGENGAILAYDRENKLIASHDTALMEGVTASMLSISPTPTGGCLLGIAIQTDTDFYQTSVYNRSSRIEVTGEVVDENKYFHVVDPEPDVPDHTVTVDTTAARLEFMKVLTSQVGITGMIIKVGSSTNIPFSLWYWDGFYPEDDPYWNADTPWCAIFISWAAAQVDNHLAVVPKEANVDNLWKKVNEKISIDPSTTIILPGDLIFFDWDNDSSPENSDLEHVGVVLFTENGYVYTIEGNSSDSVALRRYSLDNSDIYGYGRLDWK